MNHRVCWTGGLSVLVLSLCSWRSVSAQGLIWKLPEGKVSVQFEGDYVQTIKRPNEEDEVITRRKVVVMKSLGPEDGEYRGKTVPCQWVEIKIITGKATPGGVEPGPIGARIYKVLIPRERIFSELVDGKSIDQDTIFNAYIPIAKGWVQSGGKVVKSVPQPDGSSIEQQIPLTKKAAIDSEVLQVYPLISLLMHYQNLSVTVEQDDPGLSQGPTTAKRVEATRIIENPFNRVENKATLWRSDDPAIAPFGLSRWKVEIRHFTKDSIEAVTEFREATTILVEDLKMVKVENTAESELREDEP